MRIVFWNIRAGGGVREPGIARQMALWAPDLVGLCEFRGTPPSRRLARQLGRQGLHHQLVTTHGDRPAANALLLASRYSLETLQVQTVPADSQRWLLAGVRAPQKFTVGLTHIPNYVTGKKGDFRAAVLAAAHNWPGRLGLLIGDTNSGLPGIDEENPVFGKPDIRWFAGLEKAGWRDVFRHKYGDRRAYTWYSPNGRNGFRLDQAFANGALLPHVTGISYRWGGIGHQRRREQLSDHAALILDLNLL